MPPKKQQQNPKAKDKKRVQSAADKTFGLKNKNKSAKVQKYVQQVEAMAKAPASAEQKRKEAEAAKRAAEKSAADQAKEEARKLFGGQAQVQKVPFGVDPKTVVCVFFKQGNCTKGKKCKFSHDLNVDRKTVKRDIYSDEREAKEKDTMDGWDEEKLRKVVTSKHGNPQTTTDKVCKYFLEAVENGKYGWFWVCPNGGDACKYRHSLPEGFILKTAVQKRLEREAAANEPTITLEDFLETERHKLPVKLTPVTFESFSKWREDRLLMRQSEDQKEKKGTVKDLTGKEILLSSKFVESDTDEDDEDAWNMSDLARRTEELQVDNPK